MAVKLRLQRHGSKKRPFYRVVAADERSMRDGRCLEIVGTYNPISKPAKVELKMERIAHWLENGAQMSDTVNSLVKQTKKSAQASA